MSRGKATRFRVFKVVGQAVRALGVMEEEKEKGGKK